MGSDEAPWMHSDLRKGDAMTLLNGSPDKCRGLFLVRAKKADAGMYVLDVMDESNGGFVSSRNPLFCVLLSPLSPCTNRGWGGPVGVEVLSHTHSCFNTAMSTTSTTIYASVLAKKAAKCGCLPIGVLL